MEGGWLIVDDHTGFLTTARRVLEREGITILGVASTIKEALDLAKELVPDGVLVDTALGSESGFDLARRLSSELRMPPMIILISTHSEEDYAGLIAQSPAIGFLPKSDLSAHAIQELVRLHRKESGSERA